MLNSHNLSVFTYIHFSTIMFNIGLSYLGVAVARGKTLMFSLTETSLQADTYTFTHTFF